MKTMVFDIDGMSCAHCVRRVSAALQALDDVTAVAVDLEHNRATLQIGDRFDEAVARAAVAEAGYAVTAVRAA